MNPFLGKHDSSISGLSRDAFGDSAKSKAQTYTRLCNRGRRGVVDTLTALTSVKVKCRIGTVQSLSLSLSLSFSLSLSLSLFSFLNFYI